VGAKATGSDLPEIDTTTPHSARVYDYLLGGTTNFEPDRIAAQQQAAAFGGLDAARAAIRANRVFLGQVVRYLAGPAGVRQFLDIGTGIPGDDNVHAVAQQVAPDARIAYVDNDPIVLAHAHQLLAPDGSTSFVLSDLDDPADIVRQAGDTLDFDQPVALLLIALLHHFPDDADPYGKVAELVEALPSGSYLALSHMASDIDPETMSALENSVPEAAQYRFAMRSRGEVTAFFEGLDLVEPGVVRVDEWQPADLDPPAEKAVPAHHWGGVGRKP
jgi:S-adenosyl methyltransferase